MVFHLLAGDSADLRAFALSGRRASSNGCCRDLVHRSCCANRPASSPSRPTGCTPCPPADWKASSSRTPPSPTAPARDSRSGTNSRPEHDRHDRHRRARQPHRNTALVLAMAALADMLHPAGHHHPTHAPSPAASAPDPDHRQYLHPPIQMSPGHRRGSEDPATGHRSQRRRSHRPRSPPPQRPAAPRPPRPVRRAHPPGTARRLSTPAHDQPAHAESRL